MTEKPDTDWKTYINSRIDYSLTHNAVTYKHDPEQTLAHINGNVLGSLSVRFADGNITEEQYRMAARVVNDRNICPGKQIVLVEVGEKEISNQKL